MTDFHASWVARLVSAYDASGVHRASTPGDYASGEWLCGEARHAGADVSQMPVALARTVVDEAYLVCAGVRIDGLPMFDSPAAPRPIEGTLGACGSNCDIGYLELQPNAASIKGMRFEDIRRQSKHAAIVVATRVAGESLAPINAQYFDAPFGPPVLLVAGMHHELLAGHAATNTRVTLASRHGRNAAESYNVMARVTSGSDAPPVVLLTPRTGWWESTAERAGGIVAWLAGVSTASALMKTGRLARNVHAFATCGHELGHVGLKNLLTREAALLHESVRWLHLGANLGCASNLALTLRAAEPAEAGRMRDLLTAEGYPAAAIRIDPISTASGEARDVMEHGGKVLSLIGSNAHFHAASDRWPANVNAANVAAIARAVSVWVTLQSAMAVR